MNATKVRIGDIIIINRSLDTPFKSQLLIVYDVRSWGVKAQHQALEGVAPIRLSHKDYEIVGHVDASFIVL